MGLMIILIIGVIAAVFIGALCYTVRQDRDENRRKLLTGKKLMILGVELTVIGGIMSLNMDYNLEGLGVLLILAGITCNIIGIFKE